MSFFDKFDAQEAKLANILDANSLLHVFNTKVYPMRLTIMQNQAPDAQMALFETAEDGVSSRDAMLVLTFPVGEIGVRVHGRLVISDALMGKIKNHAKKMRDLWLQANFATSLLPERQRLEDDTEPECDEAESENSAAFEDFFGDDGGAPNTDE